MNAPASTSRPRPLVLAVLDGFGEREERDGNAVRLARTPTLDAIAAYPRTLLGASGADVGLPKGRAGDGAVGHRALGAGRVLAPGASRIDALVARRALGENEIVADALRIAKHHFEARLHLFGLLSQAGSHASLDHLLSLIDLAYHEGVHVVVHAFLGDGAPRAAGDLISIVENALEGDKGQIGTLSGRAYAMDRDGRWDRTNLAFQAIVRGAAPRADSAAEALALAYSHGKSDDLIEPTRVGAYTGMKGSFMCDFNGGDRQWHWYGEENALSFNLRPDGNRQLAAMLHRRGVPDAVAADMLTERGRQIIAVSPGLYATLTPHGNEPDVPVAFPASPVEATLGEVIASAGLKQLRVAESDARAHVTTFFNGGREEPYAGEDRVLVPSPRDVTSYIHAPATSAAEVAREAARAVAEGGHDVIVVNLSSLDLVAQSGKIDPAVAAVEAVDAALGVILAAVREAGGALVVTAAHGRGEQMKDTKGQPRSGATTNPVPLYLVDDARRATSLRDGGTLADVAPTLLDLLGLAQPAAMTGRSLLTR